MGHFLGTLNTRHLNLESNAQPTFKYSSGFKFTRQQRQMVAKEEHLMSARIPPKYRDYCAHYLLDYQVCRYKQFPFVYRCHHEKHDYLNCEHDDYIIRMKEFEREKRLREREIRIKSKQAEDLQPPPECPKSPPKK